METSWNNQLMMVQGEESIIELNCSGEGADEIHCSNRIIIVGVDVDHNSDFLHIRIVSIQF